MAETVEDTWIEVDVTIETTTEEKARYKVSRRDFEDWAGDVHPDELPKKIRAFLRSGEERETCGEIYEASQLHDVVDCAIRSVSLVAPTVPPHATEDPAVQPAEESA